MDSKSLNSYYHVGYIPDARIEYCGDDGRQTAYLPDYPYEIDCSAGTRGIDSPMKVACHGMAAVFVGDRPVLEMYGGTILFQVMDGHILVQHSDDKHFRIFHRRY